MRCPIPRLTVFTAGIRGDLQPAGAAKRKESMRGGHTDQPLCTEPPGLMLDLQLLGQASVTCVLLQSHGLLTALLGKRAGILINNIWRIQPFARR
jgi:hypothetical protein